MSNKQRFVPLRVFLLLGLLTAIGCVGQVAGGAQTAPAGSKLLQRPCEKRWQNASVEEIAHDLQAQYHLNLVFDGEPVRKNADIDVVGSLTDALDKIADTFDYRWKSIPGNVVIMNKRFKNPYERPQLDLPEMRQMASEIEQAMNGGLPAGIEPSRLETLLRQLSDQFTPAQKATLSSGQSLHGSDLDAGQFSLFMQALNCVVYSNPLKTAHEFAAWMELLPVSSLSAKTVSDVTTANFTPLTARPAQKNGSFRPVAAYRDLLPSGRTMSSISARSTTASMRFTTAK